MVLDTATSPVLVGHVGTVAADAVCVTTNAAAAAMVSATTAVRIAANRPTRLLVGGCIAVSLLRLLLAHGAFLGAPREHVDECRESAFRCGRAYVSGEVGTTRHQTDTPLLNGIN